MSTVSQHECKFFTKPWRGFKRCTRCRQEYTTHGGDGKTWAQVMTIRHFAEKWLPAISGTVPEKMMTVQVAYPFEFNCYESWNVVYRVRFDFSDVTERNQRGLGTRTDVMNGWMSQWAETFNKIDAEAEAYYKQRTSRDYEIGDNAYAEMRRIIQS
jgi:hypothetical protein